MQRGFTLIETIIYIALFTMLITSGFAAVYELIEGTDSLNQKVRTEEEGNFVMRKIAWSLSSMDPSIPPTISGSGCSQTLTVTKTNSVNNVVLRMRNLSGKNYIEIQDDGVNFYPITTENASTSCLRFSSTGTSPIGITATSTINGTNFVITKYVRK